MGFKDAAEGLAGAAADLAAEAASKVPLVSRLVDDGDGDDADVADGDGLLAVDRSGDVDAVTDLGEPPIADGDRRAELDALDRAAATDGDGLALPDEPGLWDRIDPGRGDLASGWSAGLRSMIENMADLGLDDGDGTFDLGLVRTILSPVGDRLSIAADDTGVTVTGLLRSRHTAWDDIQRLEMRSRYDMFSGKGVGRLSNSIVGRITPPIPGLSWLVGKVIGSVAAMLERLIIRGERREHLQRSAGYAITKIERPWFDVELDGLMQLVSRLAKGTGEAIAAEAEARGVDVVRLD